VIDLVGLPVPKDAPEPGACIRLERPEDGLVVLILDPPHRAKYPVFDVPLLMDLDAALEELAQDRELKGLVVAGRDPLTFAAGADVETIAEVDDPVLAKRFAHEGQQLFHRLFRLGRGGGGKVVTVAAVGGPVPGGACEIALACDRIVLADHDKTRIGLPEVLLGIFPAWGGSQRLPRRIGIAPALGAILTGKLYKPRQAYKLGLVDRLTKPEYLLRIAGDIALGRAKCPRRGSRGLKKLLVDKNPLAGAFIAHQARKGVLKQTKGHYPAPLAVLPLVIRAPRLSIDRGLEAEVEGVLPLSTSPIAKNLIQLFLASESAKRLARLPDGTEVAGIGRAAVIGAGVMGGGIAGLLAQKGIDTRLRDLDRGQLDNAVREHQKSMERKRKRRRLTAAQANGAIDRLEVTTEAVGFGRCEIVIEAVAEKLEIKRAVFGELAELLPDDAILATNTSSLSVGDIAATIPHPERVVGMHFFNPVPLMPLVEIVRGPQTSDEVVARTAQLAVSLGKTPVVTADVAGFLVNRVLGPYLDEAVRMVATGLDPRSIDDAIERFGMPMGPCALIDEVGLDIAVHAAGSLFAAYGERMHPSDYLQPLVEAGQLGKKTGGGMYLWRPGKNGRPKNSGRNPKLGSRSGKSLPDEVIVDRLVLAMVNEAARCIADEVVASPSELDLATVFGTGFAPFRGGVLRYADTRGLAEIVERLREIHSSPELLEEGDRRPRFEPAPNLVELAKSGGGFHG